MKLAGFLVAPVWLGLSGCADRTQCAGECEAGDGTDEGTSTGDSPTGTGMADASTSGGVDSTDDSGDDSESSGSPFDPCGGDPLALCLPATEDAGAFCLCPEPVPEGFGRSWDVIDLDGDGKQDVLTHSWEAWFQPYIATPQGLEPLDIVDTPAEIKHTKALHVDGDGTLHVLLSVTDEPDQFWHWAPGTPISITPFESAAPDPVTGSDARLADFDADGATDVIETWVAEDGSGGLIVVFDAFGSPSQWSAPLPTHEFSQFPYSIICRLDDDDADDALATAFYLPFQPFLGVPMQSSLTAGDPIELERARCTDLDQDGDADLVQFSEECSGCAATFGPFEVFEQTSPLVFESVASGGKFGSSLQGNNAILMHLFDANTFDIVNLAGDETFFADASTNFAVRRSLGALQWQGGRYVSIPGFRVDSVEPLDVDLDGLDELLVSISGDSPDFGGQHLYRLAAE